MNIDLRETGPEGEKTAGCFKAALGQLGLRSSNYHFETFLRI